MKQKIDINSADVPTLTQLDGIGETLAQRIIEYRETVHPFEEVIELTAVPGISERMVRQFADQATIQSVVAGTLPMTTPIPVDNLHLTAEPAVEVAGDESEGDDDSETTAVSTPAIDEETADLPPLHETPPAGTGESSAKADEPAAEQPETPAAEQTETPPAEEVTTAPAAPRFAEEPEPAFTTTPPPAADDTVSRRRGCLFVAIGAILGAVLGAALTLGILSAINNGSLRFVQADNQLRLQIDDANRQLEALNAQLEAAGAQLDAAESRLGDLAGAQGTMGNALSSVETAVSTAESDIDALEETAAALDERLDTVADAAETFDAFLNGMRDLLVTLQGPPPTATVTPTAVPTETGVEDAPDAGTSTPTPAATQPPTRTPRPTATSIVAPTATPAQQP